MGEQQSDDYLSLERDVDLSPQIQADLERWDRQRAGGGALAQHDTALVQRQKEGPELAVIQQRFAWLDQGLVRRLVLLAREHGHNKFMIPGEEDEPHDLLYELETDGHVLLLSRLRELLDNEDFVGFFSDHQVLQNILRATPALERKAARTSLELCARYITAIRQLEVILGSLGENLGANEGDWQNLQGVLRTIFAPLQAGSGNFTIDLLRLSEIFKRSLESFVGYRESMGVNRRGTPGYISREEIQPLAETLLFVLRSGNELLQQINQRFVQ